jgi:hypothetical protein
MLKTVKHSKKIRSLWVAIQKVFPSNLTCNICHLCNVHTFGIRDTWEFYLFIFRHEDFNHLRIQTNWCRWKTLFLDMLKRRFFVAPRFYEKSLKNKKWTKYQVYQFLFMSAKVFLATFLQFYWLFWDEHKTLSFKKTILMYFVHIFQLLKVSPHRTAQ